jgi:probable F420-dependent oxidoreductase
MTPAAQLGVYLAVAGLRVEELAAFVVDIEQLGYESFWLGEHIVVPRNAEAYPYSQPPFRYESEFVDPFTAFAYLSALTQRIRFGTAVTILPQREVLTFAKQVATADRLSRGRMLVGVGAGWCREEFRALGAKFELRGEKLDEQIAVLRAIGAGESLSFRGKYHSFDDMGFFPKPFQLPFPPLHVGGDTTFALRRAARLGDGWFSGARNGLPEIAAQCDVLFRKLDEYERPQSSCEVTVPVALEDITALFLEKASGLGVTRVALRVNDMSQSTRDRLSKVADDWGVRDALGARSLAAKT